MKRLRLFRKARRFLGWLLPLSLSAGLCTVLVLFLCRHCGFLRGEDGYDFRPVPLGVDDLSTCVYELSGIDFDRVSSLSVQLKGGAPAALLMIPDYDYRDFRCLRLSTFPGLPSGYLRYRNGKTVSFAPVVPEERRPLAYTTGFVPGLLPRPRSALSLVAIPPSSAPDRAASAFALILQDGGSLSIRLNPWPPLMGPLVAGLVLGFLVLHLDRRVLRAYRSRVTRGKAWRRMLVLRVFALIYVPLLVFREYGMLSIPATPAYTVYVVLISLLIFIGLLGGYRVAKTRVKKWEDGSGDPWFALGLGLAVLLPLLVQGFLLQLYQYSTVRRFEVDRVFHGEKIEREDPGQRVVLCMGGSSTEGSPFDHEWPYDYPSELERVLKERGVDARVANAGVIATTSPYALAHMPEILESLKPQVVTVNYLNNDSGASVAEWVLGTLKGMGLTGWVERYGANRRRQIRELVRLVRKSGAACVLLLEPHFEYVYLDRDPFPEVRQMIREVAQEEGARLVDPNPSFKKERDRPLFIDSNVHLTRFGTRLLAETLAPAVGDLLSASQGREAISNGSAASLAP